MKIIDRRLRKLEGEFEPAEPQPCCALVVRSLAQELALDPDTCVEILRECGFLSSSPVLCRGSWQDPGWAECEGDGEVPA